MISQEEGAVAMLLFSLVGAVIGYFIGIGKNTQAKEITQERAIFGKRSHIYHVPKEASGRPWWVSIHGKDWEEGFTHREDAEKFMAMIEAQQ